VRPQDSTGRKQKLGPIAVLRRAQENPGKYPWLTQLLARRPFKVVAVALANKMARTVWALMVCGGTYGAPELAEGCPKRLGEEEKRRCKRVHELQG
jgi:transposase